MELWWWWWCEVSKGKESGRISRGKRERIGRSRKGKIRNDDRDGGIGKDEGNNNMKEEEKCREKEINGREKIEDERDEGMAVVLVISQYKKTIKK